MLLHSAWDTSGWFSSPLEYLGILLLFLLTFWFFVGFFYTSNVIKGLYFYSFTTLILLQNTFISVKRERTNTPHEYKNFDRYCGSVKKITKNNKIWNVSVVGK